MNRRALLSLLGGAALAPMVPAARADPRWVFLPITFIPNDQIATREVIEAGYDLAHSLDEPPDDWEPPLTPEYAAAVRRAFIPATTVQFYQLSPVMMAGAFFPEPSE